MYIMYHNILYVLLSDRQRAVDLIKFLLYNCSITSEYTFPETYETIGHDVLLTVFLFDRLIKKFSVV